AGGRLVGLVSPARRRLGRRGGRRADAARHLGGPHLGGDALHLFLRQPLVEVLLDDLAPLGVASSCLAARLDARRVRPDALPYALRRRGGAVAERDLGRQQAAADTDGGERDPGA